ncbi:SPOR domain-containing protein [Thiomicrospira sp.]|uniref:SPOR domain-containing protein n=1 Tax=Thiomicrospira sp. TaxID=935 RepID=UPI002F95D815
MDELTKYRITGAVIWLALLIMLVPSWYANPVDYEKAQPWLYSSSDELSPVDELPPAKEVSQTSVIVSDQTTETTKSEPVVTVDTNKDTSNTSAQTQNDISSKEAAQTKQSSDNPEIANAKKSSTTEVELDEPMTTQETAEIKEPVMPSEDKSPAWLVRVASYNSIESANRTLGVLEMRYKVTIGDFSTKNQKIYSVRVGPFLSFQEAQKAKQELDKELVTNSVIVQIR